MNTPVDVRRLSLVRFRGHLPKDGTMRAATVHREFMAGPVPLVLDEGKRIGPFGAHQILIVIEELVFAPPIVFAAPPPP
jgi:hypothetical protein